MTKDVDSLARSLEEAAAFLRGENIPVRIWEVKDGKAKEIPNCRAIRAKLALTQSEMAKLLGTSPSGYRKWEQARRTPSGAALALLRVLEKEPDAVIRALS